MSIQISGAKLERLEYSEQPFLKSMVVQARELRLTP